MWDSLVPVFPSRSLAVHAKSWTPSTVSVALSPALGCHHSWPPRRQYVENTRLDGSGSIAPTPTSIGLTNQPFLPSGSGFVNETAGGLLSTRHSTSMLTSGVSGSFVWNVTVARCQRSSGPP